LLSLADLLEENVKKIRGAAHRLSPQKLITMADCELQNWENIRPCFALSTGRSGTLLLNRLLMLSPTVFAVHNPKPELVRASKRAYEEIDNYPDIFEETFKSAREELVFEAALRDKTFVETNNQITFFAPVIRKVFPKAVFIHIVRHPGDFVRSGVRRKWFSGEHSHDFGRIIPNKGEYKTKWLEMTQIEKIGWLWNETNQFIEEFLRTLSKDDYIFIKSEDLFKNPEASKEVYSFLEIKAFNRRAVRKAIQKPINVQKKGEFPQYQHWSNEEKDTLKNVTPLAQKYGYTL
jgi:hypothetical protein